MDGKFLPFLKDENISFHLEQAYCYPAKGCYKAVINFEGDLSPLFPLLRAISKTLYFDPQEGIIFKFQHNGKDYKVSLSKREISFTLVSDKDEAYEVWEGLRNFLEEVWQRRAEIEPSYKPVQRPSAIEIYKFLPKTNCKECGFMSCLAFAGALSTGDAELETCSFLNDEAKKSLIEKLF